MTASDWIGRHRTGILDTCFAGGFCALFVKLHGLPVGVGNQSLHLAWIRHMRDPELFSADPLVHSFSQFPSFFFQIFARLIPPGMSPETALQLCQIGNTFFLFLACIRLARTLTPGSTWSWCVPLFFLLEPTRALAETPLPPIAFSHTALGLTLALFALNALFQEKLSLSAVLFALLANIHLLTAAYAGSVAALYVLLTIRNRLLKHLLLPFALGVLFCLPVLLGLLHSSGTVYDSQWLQLLRERSGHHVFPATWWRTGDAVIARYILMLGWLPLCLSLLPKDQAAKARLALWVAPAALMLLGAFGAFILPHPPVLRGQFFRASLYPLLLLFLTAPGAAEFSVKADQKVGTKWAVLLIAGAALFIPAFADLTPFALGISILTLWWSGSLRTVHALALVPVFPLIALSDRVLDTHMLNPFPLSLPDRLSLCLLLTCLLVGIASTLHHRMRTQVVLLATGVLTGLAAVLLFPSAESRSDSWQDIQALTRHMTPPDAVILTPTRRAGFRDGSQRSIVGEWRDGTMQFFDPEFARQWDLRMTDLSPERTRRFQPADWVAAGERYQAAYAVLPAGQAAGLITVAQNHDWALVKTERPPLPPLPDPPENALDAEEWLEQERFVREVVTPNIERHRVRTVNLQLVDDAGAPLSGYPLEIEQTRLAFGVGSALHHFHKVPQREKGFNAPLNHPKELERFLEIFNFSVIGYSGKWFYLEPEPGKRTYEDLDAYVDWCTRHNIRIQYHFVTGYEPGWMRKKSAGFRRKALMVHANALIDRYGDRIDEWQIINERRMQSDAPGVFELFRKRQPNDRLGVSHCARFYTEREGEKGQMDLKRGWRSMNEIQGKGQEVDFFAIHAHRPFGVLSDPRTMYEVLDDFQEEGVRVTISETGIPHFGEITGSVLKGNWTPEKQAEHLIRFYKVIYSHPNVDAVNFWGFGPKTWQKGIGLLDRNYEPLPAFHALKKLVKEDWASRAEGRSGHGGRFSFTGHRGEYLVTLRHPDGRVGTGQFAVEERPEASVPVTVQWESDPES